MKIDARWVYLAALMGLLVGVLFWPTVWGPQWELLAPATALLLVTCTTVVAVFAERPHA